MIEAEKKNAAGESDSVQVEKEKNGPLKPDNSFYHEKKELSRAGTAIFMLCAFVLGILVGLMIALYVSETLDRREAQKQMEPIMAEVHTAEAVDRIVAGVGKSETETTDAAASERRTK